MSLDRRAFLKSAALGLAAGALPVSGIGFAQGAGPRRLLLIELAGAVDGLALAVPHGDPAYATLRGWLAEPGPDEFDGVLDLDGLFGLPRAARALAPLWQARELALVPAVGMGHDNRDPTVAAGAFATADPGRAGDSGWMGRLARAMEGRAVSVGLPAPAVLAGGGTRVDPPGTPRPIQGFEQKLRLLVQDDPVLGIAFDQALDSRREGIRDPGRAVPRGLAALDYLGLTARVLADPAGPRMAALQVGGWDFDRDQGGNDGKAGRRIAGLAHMLALLPGLLGPAVWAETVVLVAAWAGRTVSPNRLGGTDVGVGQTVLLAGGAVAGGQLAGPWAGLGEAGVAPDGALIALSDFRAILKAVLENHLALDGRAIDRVLPAARATAPMIGLLR